MLELAKEGSGAEEESGATEDQFAEDLSPAPEPRQVRQKHGSLYHRRGSGSPGKRRNARFFDEQALLDEVVRQREIGGLSGKDAFRSYCRKRFGGLREAMKAIDPNGNALVSFQEFRSAIELYQIPYVQITGAPSIKELWQQFDKDGNGTIDKWELMGDAGVAEIERQKKAEYDALGTVAQWDRYVSRSTRGNRGSAGRGAAKWQKWTPSSIGSVLRAEERAAGNRRDFVGVVPLAGTTQIYGLSQVFHSVAFFAKKEYEKRN